MTCYKTRKSKFCYFTWLTDESSIWTYFTPGTWTATAISHLYPSKFWLEKRPLLLNLNLLDIFFWNFYYCFWTGKCFLGHNHIVLSTILQWWRSALILMFQARNHKYRHKWDLTDNLQQHSDNCNNCNNKTLCAICSNQWRHFDIFTVNFKQISLFVLFSLLTLNIQLI